MKGNFSIIIESLHCADNGSQENAHELSLEKLKAREVQFIDIANDSVSLKVSFKKANFCYILL
jgi:PREDICTED: similar to AGAP001957-PA